ncbi:hypothetical protein SJA_C1-11690 [Sphingobium indicum UT26S]|uniref:Uncharacterized protein n=1 Tax=Sphingobium indicum (strain DSM 16413 / CCM 7287 / MTCC 6362 / UT26 / NBRC 101211 / UT26S) TaxID=452662 RepID=D4Z071_SPHIU|nr:hypothetical protein SJA_C1-11690 [Sphingobium indicum UT26S]
MQSSGVELERMAIVSPMGRALMFQAARYLYRSCLRIKCASANPFDDRYDIHSYIAQWYRDRSASLNERELCFCLRTAKGGGRTVAQRAQILRSAIPKPLRKTKPSCPLSIAEILLLESFRYPSQKLTGCASPHG